MVSVCPVCASVVSVCQVCASVVSVSSGGASVFSACLVHTGDSDAEDSENFESSASNMAAPDKRVFRRSWFCMLRVVYQRDFRHIPRSADIKNVNSSKS